MPSVKIPSSESVQIIQIVELTDKCIDKIADAVVKKLAKENESNINCPFI